MNEGLESVAGVEYADAITGLLIFGGVPLALCMLRCSGRNRTQARTGKLVTRRTTEVDYDDESTVGYTQPKGRNLVPRYEL